MRNTWSVKRTGGLSSRQSSHVKLQAGVFYWLSPSLHWWISYKMGRELFCSDFLLQYFFLLDSSVKLFVTSKGQTFVYFCPCVWVVTLLCFCRNTFIIFLLPVPTGTLSVWRNLLSISAEGYLTTKDNSRKNMKYSSPGMNCCAWPRWWRLLIQRPSPCWQLIKIKRPKEGNWGSPKMPRYSGPGFDQGSNALLDSLLVP